MPRAGTVRIRDERTPEERDRAFLPGAGRAWLLPLYDVRSRLAGVRPLHEKGVELAGIEAGQTVLDVGCGTGDLALAVLAAQPEARVTGVDPDGAALLRAARKAGRGGVSLMLIQGYADRLVSEDSSLDHVVSSLAVHHLEDGDRLTFAREALRTLRRGGKITIIDFGGPTDAADDGTDTGGHVHQGQHGHEHGHGHGVRHLPGLLRSLVTRKPAAAHDMGVDLPRLLTEAGFRDAREVGYVDHRLGRISFVQATRP